MQRAAAGQRDGDERRLALARGQGEQPRAQGRAERPGRVGGEGAEGVCVAGFLGDEDRGLVGGVRGRG